MDNFFRYNKKWKEKYIAREILSGDYELFVDEIKTNGIGRDIYYFPCMREEFCNKLIEITNKLNLWGKFGHESYRTNDTWLRNIGLDDVYNEFINEYMIDLLIYLYKTDKPNKLKEEDDDDSDMKDGTGTENFVIKYIPETNDEGLSIHVDDSDISLQLSLNNPSDYKGGGTWYPKQNTLLKLPIGYMSVHPGNVGFRHGARAIKSGKRYNLVSFIKVGD